MFFQKIKKTILYFFLIAFALSTIYPFVWMSLTSFKGYAEAAGNKEWPFAFTPGYFSRNASTTTLDDFRVGHFVYIEGSPGHDGCGGWAGL